MTTDNTLTTLRQALDRINPLAPDAWSAVAELAVVRSIGPGAHLIRAATPARHIYFAHRGLLREYYLDSTGNESTRRFCKAGEFSGSLADLIARGPIAVSIEALSPCELIEMEWAAIDALAEQHPSLMKLLRRFAEVLYVRKMQREFDMLTLTAAQRYQRFSQSEPELNAHLPRHMIASYLGITAVHLSRICADEKPPKLQSMQKGKTKSAP